MPEMTKHIPEIHREVMNNTGDPDILSQMARFAILTHLRSNERPNMLWNLPVFGGHL